MEQVPAVETGRDIPLSVNEPVAVISVPHSGTHAVMWMLGWRRGLNFVGPLGSTERTLAINGHVWYRDGEPPKHFTADGWAPYLEGRKVYMPVREAGALAWSWVNVHRIVYSKLIDNLREAVRFIQLYAPTLVNIHALKPQNVKGSWRRDEEAANELNAMFPEYFGALNDGR